MVIISLRDLLFNGLDMDSLVVTMKEISSYGLIFKKNLINFIIRGKFKIQSL